MNLEKKIGEMQLEMLNLREKIVQLQEQLSMKTLSEEILMKNNQ